MHANHPIDAIGEHGFYDRFRAPGPDMRPAPFWVWNEAITPEQIRLQLQAIRANGFGGAFVHARPGMLTEYLSDEWWRLWTEALEIAESLDMKLYIYDENSYPSGFAGGHVLSALPDCAAGGAAASVYDLDGPSSALPPAIPGLIKAWAAEPRAEIGIGTEAGAGAEIGVETEAGIGTGPGAAPVWRHAADAAAGPLALTADVTDVPLSDWPRFGRRFLVFTQQHPVPSRWLGGFTYVDLMRPEVTEHFLRTTHEAYRERFGDRFGTRIPALFTDEPEITNGNLYAKDDYLAPFTYWFASRFEQLRGYNLPDHLPCLLFDASGAGIVRDYRKVRYDFYATIRELWAANSVQPISAWCREHGIAYTGHYVEHNWPHPFHRTSPAIMSLYEYMDWPAIDMLHTHLLRADGTDSHDLVTIREAHSAANQLGKARVLCEAYGAGGWESTFEDYRRIGDWLMAHGVNFINQHLTFDSIVGPRKRDHPQSFDWRQSWWSEYGALNDYFGRLSAALSQGETFARVLVLNPTTSTFLMTPQEEQGTAYRDGVERTRLLVQRLCDTQWDFDLGDEYIIERHGHARDGKFHIGSRTYQVVVLPPALRHLKESTLQRLETFLADGGLVLAMCEPILYIEGEADERGKALARHASWHDVGELEQLDAQLRRSLLPPIAWSRAGTVRSGVAHLRRQLADGCSLHFIANSHPAALEDEVYIEGSSAERWDAWTGEREPIGEPLPDGRIRIPVRLSGSESLLLHVSGNSNSNGSSGPRAETSPAEPQPQAAATPPAEHGLRIEADRPNMMPLQFVDLRVGAKSYRDVHVLYAAERIFQHHGFAANPLDSGVQFRDRVLDRDRFMDSGSGFQADYAVHLSADAGSVPPDIRLLVERPELYEIAVNGMPLTAPFEPSRLDRHIGAAPISRLLVPGHNRITLRAQPFSVLHELEAIYLEGDFSVVPAAERWTIAPPQPLGMGSWKDQGRPFYDGSVIYRRSAEVPSWAQRVVLTLPGWHGTVAAVFVDDRPAGFIGIDRSGALDISAYAGAGMRQFAVKVCGSARNLLGPHFDPKRPRGYVWPGNWRAGGRIGSPPPDRYDLIDYGLFEEMKLTFEGER